MLLTELVFDDDRRDRACQSQQRIDDLVSVSLDQDDTRGRLPDW